MNRRPFQNRFTSFFCSKKGSNFWIILCFFFQCLQASFAQDLECIKLPCTSPGTSKLKVEIVRQNAISSDCQGMPSQYYDYFHQITYTVYLRYSSPTQVVTPTLSNGNGSFFLDYRYLNVSADLRPINGLQYSQIDAKNTKDYFEKVEHSDWANYGLSNGDKPIFTISSNSSSISFQNQSTSSACGTTGGSGNNWIQFTPGTPTNGAQGTNQYNYYAALFTVIVNAYPGETIAFDSNIRILTNSDGGSCDPITNENSGNYNGGTNYSVPVLSPPVSNNTTNNAKIKVELSNPSMNPYGGYDVDVNVTNIDANNSITVNYIDFTIEAASLNPGNFSYLGYKPYEVDGGTNLSTGHKITKLVYIIPQIFTLDKQSTKTLGKITINQSELSNLSWSVYFTFENLSTKARLKTTIECTTLVNNDQTVIVSNPNGVPSCGTSDNVKFLIQGDNSDCNHPKLRVGFYSTQTVTKLLPRLNFIVDIPMLSNNYLTSADFSHWPTTNCNNAGCTMDQNHPCYTLNSTTNTFEYCYLSATPISFTFDATNHYYYIELSFNGSLSSCVDVVRVKYLLARYLDSQSNAEITCIPAIGKDGLPICSTPILGTIMTEVQNGVEDVSVYLSGCQTSCTGTCTSSTTLSDNTGSYGFCSLCANCSLYTVTPSKDDNPLNGVSTYDLLLISKHILSIETLNSPYKLIAADANKSGSVTTFDIVELRKLILGIYTELPANKSWRFIDKSFSFQNPLNPFETLFPEEITCIPAPSTNVNFVAVKVGDVNNTALANSRPASKPTLSLQIPPVNARSPQVVTIPVIYSGAENVEAIQFGLRFDPTKWALIGPSIGDLPGYTADNFGLKDAGRGIIKTLWFPWLNEIAQIKPGTIMFYLSFQPLRRDTSSAEILQLDNGNLENSAWDKQGLEYGLQLARAAADARFVQPESALATNVTTFPNPSAGSVSFLINQNKPGKAYLAIFGAFGNRIALHRFDLNEGETRFLLQDLESQPSGVYGWELHVGEQKAHGNIVKQ